MPRMNPPEAVSLPLLSRIRVQRLWKTEEKKDMVVAIGGRHCTNLCDRVKAYGSLLEVLLLSSMFEAGNEADMRYRGDGFGGPCAFPKLGGEAPLNRLHVAFQ